MSSITYDRFDVGLDLRRGDTVSEPNKLRVLINAHITTGKSVKKRPCLQHVTTLEAGTKGLRSANGKLQTYYESGTVTHANTLFNPNKVPHPTTSQQVKRVWSHEVFNGYIYVSVEFLDDSVFHYYLDDPGAWVALTNYSLGQFRRPTVANGFRYEVTTDAGSSGAVQPTWPTTVGGTVVDGGITWTCRSTSIADTNCPHGKGFQKLVQKIWSVKKAEPYDVVRFCAAVAPRDWTTANDAGFLPVSTQQENARECYAVGQFQNQLVAYFDTGAQIWNVSSDPDLNALEQKIYGVGTVHPLTPTAFASDNFFLAAPGIRSIMVSSQFENKQDNDVGSPIDKLVPASIGSNVPRGLYFTTKSQFWLVVGSVIWVYSYSRSSKLAAWSKYILPFNIDDFDEIGGTVYMRNGDDVYKFEDSVYTDDGEIVQVEVEMPFVDLKLPGVLKQIMGVDAVLEGSARMYLKYDPKNELNVTAAIAISGDTRPEDMTPPELCAVTIAPRIVHAADEDFELHALQFYYEALGPM